MAPEIALLEKPPKDKLEAGEDAQCSLPHILHSCDSKEPGGLHSTVMREKQTGWTLDTVIEMDHSDLGNPLRLVVL